MPGLRWKGKGSGKLLWTVRAFRVAGKYIREFARGSGDDAVLAKAQSEARVLITFDKDFGELVFRRGKSASCGIVLFRLRKLSPDFVARRVAKILESTAEWEGHYAVVDEHSIRLRPLP
jgi:predicted nuclease of predicted toxin-antitoxin system